MPLHLRHNIPDAVLALEDLRKDQLPFATSLALNILVRTAQEEETKGIFDRFEIRRPQRLKTAVRITQWAKKRELRAMIEIRDKFLVQHEGRQIREPGDVYRSIVQPVREQERRIGVLRGRGSPRGLLRQKKAFVQRMKSGKVGIFVRKGKKRLPIILVFALERQSKLRGLLKFGATVVRVSQRDWHKAFGEAFSRALATRRPR